MVVRREDVLRAANLAHLQLDTVELDRLASEIEDIIGHMAVLRTLDLHGVPPFSSPAALERPLRSDEPGADPLLLKPGEIAPAWEDGFFTVPRLEAHRDDAPAQP
jgi:aspartyl-tRNA(Asn)/glutamyl-tRNA(Gln) amidotransferase subunit C